MLHNEARELLVRRYGRSQAKARVVDHAPLSTPKSTTIVSSMRRNGATAFVTLSGSMNGERFIAYLEETLIPTLETGDHVVMDNLGSHHVKGVEERIRAADAFPLYLPPYSPDLTPIGKLWSKIKATLRKERVRPVGLLPLAVADTFALVRPEDCAGWFAASGYSCDLCGLLQRPRSMPRRPATKCSTQSWTSPTRR